MMVDVVSYTYRPANGSSSSKVRRRSAAVWRCSAFTVWTGRTHTMTLSHDVSAINIVLEVNIVAVYFAMFLCRLFLSLVAIVSCAICSFYLFLWQHLLTSPLLGRFPNLKFVRCCLSSVYFRRRRTPTNLGLPPNLIHSSIILFGFHDNIYKQV